MRPDDVVARTPTARAGLPTRWQDREAGGRRIGISLLVLVLLAAVTGLLGPRTGTTTSRTGDISVTHPTLTRPGLDTQLIVTIPKRTDSVRYRLLVDRRAFDALGLETIIPEPVSMTSRGDDIELESKAMTEMSG